MSEEVLETLKNGASAEIYKIWSAEIDLLFRLSKKQHKSPLYHPFGFYDLNPKKLLQVSRHDFWLGKDIYGRFLGVMLELLGGLVYDVKVQLENPVTKEPFSLSLEEYKGRPYLKVGVIRFKLKEL